MTVRESKRSIYLVAALISAEIVSGGDVGRVEGEGGAEGMLESYYDQHCRLNLGVYSESRVDSRRATSRGKKKERIDARAMGE